MSAIVAKTAQTLIRVMLPVASRGSLIMLGFLAAILFGQVMSF